MYCSKCGEKNTGESNYCVKCGAVLDSSTSNNVVEVNRGVSQVIDVKSVDNQNASKGKGVSIVGFILSLTGILCGVTVIVGFILSIIGVVQSKKSGKANGLGIAGLIISSLYLLLVILVGMGVVLPSKEITVADFSIMSREDAKKWCKEQDANCYFKEDYSDTVEEGEFISQSVEYGEKVRTYSSIYITYSRGKVPEIENNTSSNNGVKKEKTPQKTAEEIKNEYKESCQSYGYKDIARQPDNYIGNKAKFRGKVIQVSEGIINSNKITLRVDVTEGEYGWWDDTVYVTYTYRTGEPKILEDDIINMYGTLEGSETYTSVLGARITIPSFKAKYIDIEQ